MTRKHKGAIKDFELFRKLGIVALLLAGINIIIVTVAQMTSDLGAYTFGVIFLISFLSLFIICFVRYEAARTRWMIADMLKKDLYPKYCFCDHCQVLRESEND